MASAGSSSKGSGCCREAADDDDDGGFRSSVSVDPDSVGREIGCSERKFAGSGSELLCARKVTYSEERESKRERLRWMCMCGRVVVRFGSVDTRKGLN